MDGLGLWDPRRGGQTWKQPSDPLTPYNPGMGGLGVDNVGGLQPVDSVSSAYGTSITQNPAEYQFFGMVRRGGGARLEDIYLKLVHLPSGNRIAARSDWAMRYFPGSEVGVQNLLESAGATMPGGITKAEMEQRSMRDAREFSRRTQREWDEDFAKQEGDLLSDLTAPVRAAKVKLVVGAVLGLSVVGLGLYWLTRSGGYSVTPPDEIKLLGPLSLKKKQ